MKFVVRTLIISAAAAVAISTAYAQSASIAKRQNILKGWGDATKPVAAMLKGEAAYDGAAVQKALAAYSAGAKELVGLFPDDSKTGGDTAALRASGRTRPSSPASTTSWPPMRPPLPPPSRTRRA